MTHSMVTVVTTSNPVTGDIPGSTYEDLTTSERYSRVGSVVVSRTKKRWGGLSNMCGGFPLVVNGIEFRTSESLYQSCRYPEYPEVQRYVIDQTSPMMSKRIPNRSELSDAIGLAPIVKISLIIPPTPVAAPWYGSTAEG